MGATTEGVRVDGEKLMPFVFRTVEEVGDRRPHPLPPRETPFNLVFEARP